ncbi:MAG: TetR/AcrR family transcriptional regulator [Proteobacteria bacterium]|nr:TetR/AcrR family transcriptional regulator [Pseudomonadota bacterium]
MKKKELQEQRMKGYFIQATKEILRGESFSALSVRNIADRAGYSYATLYNYFKNINELVLHCIKDFQDECEEIVKSDVENCPKGTEKIKAIIRSYSNYFVQYPSVFTIFFLERIQKSDYQKTSINLIYSFTDRLCSNEWDFCVREGVFSEEETNLKKDQIRFAVTGLLLFYLNRRLPVSYEEFTKLLDSQLNPILQISCREA